MSTPIDLVDLEYPFTGRWLVQNSPADLVPSHGTTLFASSYAIDFVPVSPDGRSAPVRLRTLFRPETPESFPGFGRRILSPAVGTVVGIHDGEPDHHAYRGFPSIRYALGQRGRAAEGWISVAGNHVQIDIGGAVVFLCHLQRDSITVRPGDRVSVGEPIARCGNSGSSTEPHVHVQVVTTQNIEEALPVPLSFRGSLPVSGEVVMAR